jgi:hypothetical protein
VWTRIEEVAGTVGNLIAEDKVKHFDARSAHLAVKGARGSGHESYR